MAYRFNPPPNWPIEDASWSPPPGWQPDPSWGPAPEGWNFWIAQEQPPAAPEQPEAPAPADGEDDATHVAGSGQRAAAAEAPDEQGAPLAPAPSDGAPQTAEYQGPDLAADLAQQTPYESTEPVADQGQDPHAPQGGRSDEASGAGGAAAGAAASGYGQGDPAQGYGQAYPAPGYGQGSPAPAYGQGTPAPGYGQGSASDYPVQGYGQGSPGVDSGAAWTASTGAGEPPRKSFLRRFWWLGCLVILLLVLILLIGGGIWLFSRDSGNDTGGGGGATTSQEETTDGDESAAEEPSEESAAEDEDATPEAVTPTDLVTIDPSAEPIDFVGTDGTGTMAVHMTYAKAEDLESSWGGTVEESEYGEYLVVTAELTVTEGEVDLNPFQFSVKTPYGGAVDPSSESYSLVGSGLGGNAPNEFEAGDEYTVQMLFEVARAGGNTLTFDTYTDNYTWDVPE